MAFYPTSFTSQHFFTFSPSLDKSLCFECSSADRGAKTMQEQCINMTQNDTGINKSLHHFAKGHLWDSQIMKEKAKRLCLWDVWDAKYLFFQFCNGKNCFRWNIVLLRAPLSFVLESLVSNYMHVCLRAARPRVVRVRLAEISSIYLVSSHLSHLSFCTVSFPRFDIRIFLFGPNCALRC